VQALEAFRREDDLRRTRHLWTRLRWAWRGK
jgi:hypothetical protein